MEVVPGASQGARRGNYLVQKLWLWIYIKILQSTWQSRWVWWFQHYGAIMTSLGLMPPLRPPSPQPSQHHCIVHHQSANRARAAGQTRLGSALGFSVSFAYLHFCFNLLQITWESDKRLHIVLSVGQYFSHPAATFPAWNSLKAPVRLS